MTDGRSGPVDGERDNGNGRITLALLVQKLDSLALSVEAGRIEARQTIKDHEDRIRLLESTTTKLSERLTISNVAQGFFTSIAAAAAALFGRGIH